MPRRLADVFATAKVDGTGFARDLKTTVTRAAAGVAATVKAKADATGLSKELHTAAATASEGVNAQVGVDLDSSGLNRTVRAAAARASSGASATVKLKASNDEFMADMAKARVSVDRLHQKMHGLELGINDKTRPTFNRLSNNIRVTELKLRKLGAMKVTPEVQAQTAKAMAELAKFEVAANKIDGRTLEQTLKINVNKDRHSFLGSMSNMMGSATRIVGESANNMSGILREPKVLIGVLAIALLSLPLLAQLAGGAIIFALGGAIAGLAISFAMLNKQVLGAWKDLTNHMGAAMTRVSKPFEGVLKRLFPLMARMFDKIIGPLGETIKIIAPAFERFANAMVRAFGSAEMQRAITKIGQAFRAIMDALTPVMSRFIKDLANGISDIAEAVKKNPKAFSTFIGFLLKIVTGSLSAIAALYQFATFIEQTLGNLNKNTVKSLNDMISFFTKFGSVLTKAWGATWSWVSGRAQDAMNFVTSVASNFWHHVAGFFQNLGSGIRRIWSSLWGWASGRAQDAMNFIGSVASNFWHREVGFFSNLAGGVRRIWSALWGWASGRAQDAINFVSTVTTRFWHNEVGFFSNLAGGIRRIWSSLWGWASGRVQDAINFMSSMTQRFWHNMVGWFGNLMTAVRRVWGNLWDGLKDVCRGAVKTIGGIIGNIRDLFAKPFRWVVEHVWHPFASTWNKVTSAVGLDLHLPTGFARGGIVPGTGNRDSVPAVLTPNERVLSTDQVKQMGGHSAIDAFLGAGGSRDNFHFAKGGSVKKGDSGMRPGGVEAIANRGQSASGSGGIGGIFSSIWSGIKGAAGGLLDILMKPVSFIMRKMFLPIIDQAIPGTFTGGKKFLHAALEKLANFGSGRAHAAAGSGSGSAIVKFASKYIGKVPYVWGGNTPSGWDCSGFTKWVYEHCGVGKGMPRVAADQKRWTKPIGSPVPGALAFFGSSDNPHHVGIVKTKDLMINAAHSGTLTRIDSMRGRDLNGFGIPPHGFMMGGVGGMTKGHGLVPANAMAIGRYLMARGLSRAAVAGILGNIQRESGGNPESVGTGGGGLIGWTPLPRGMVTGSPARDLAYQLGKLMLYIRQNGSVGDINRHASSAGAAAQWFSNRYERPGIPAMSQRIASARASFRAFGNGGRITEPIVGFGTRSGGGYLFGERGNETVVPDGGGSSYGIEARLDALISLMAAAPGATGAAVAGGFNGMSRSAGYKAMYPNSGGGSR